MEISLWNLYVNIGAKGLKGLLNGHDVSGLSRIRSEVHGILMRYRL